MRLAVIFNLLWKLILVLGSLLRKLPSLLTGLSFSDSSFLNFLEQLKLLLQGLPNSICTLFYSSNETSGNIPHNKMAFKICSYNL